MVLVVTPHPQADSSDYFDLGAFHRPISTNSEDAQVWFDRGLVWCYAFNRGEAVSCFKEAISADPKCAMAHWGLAYASGPYYNQSWSHLGREELQSTLNQTHASAMEACRNARGATSVERALIRALQARYPDDKPPEDFSTWDQDYANAMFDVYEKFGDDLDVAVFCAEAFMVLTPWALWDPWSGEPAPKARTLEAKAIIEHALAGDGGYDHPGLLHFYIHLMEMSREPEVTLKAADRLRHLIPEAGHLNHMPSHIDVLVGDYRRAIEANVTAVRSDNLYISKAGPFNRYTLYQAHDLHSLVYAAMFAARSTEALHYSILLEKALPENVMRKGNMADWAEVFYGVRPHVLIRFGRWQDILNLELPKDQKLFCYTTATIHYAKGVAWAATGHVKEAEEEQQLFRAATRRISPTRMDFPNNSSDILPIAEEMLCGEIEYRKGNYDLAYKHLRKSVVLDDNLGYSEPWSWMQPTRHALGALLMEQGRYEEAAPVYEDDLGLNPVLPRGHQHPNNIWALVGYHECLMRLGRKAEARLLELPLAAAKHYADVDVASSCFCKRGVSGRASCCSNSNQTKLQSANKL